MAEIASLIARLKVDGTSKAKKSLQDVRGEMSKTATTTSKTSATTKKASSSFANLGSVVKGVAAGFIAFESIGRVSQFLSESADAAREQRDAMRQLNAVIKSTGGVAGVSASEAAALASELQTLTNVGDEATIRAEALLLTFTNIGSDVFPRAVRSILDVSTAMDQSLKQTTQQVGVALNDPIEGLSRLRRVGIQFNQTQEETIRKLVETGQTAEAQAIILQELETQFGGSAEAMRDEATQTANAWGDLMEVIGQDVVAAQGQAASSLRPLIELTTEHYEEIKAGTLAAFGHTQALVDLANERRQAANVTAQLAQTEHEHSASLEELNRKSQAAATGERELDTVTQQAITSLLNARGAVDDFNIGAEDMVNVLGRVVPTADAANRAIGRFADATARADAARAQLDPRAALEQAEFGIFAAQSRLRGATTLEAQQEARADLLEAQVDYQNALKRIQAEEQKTATATASSANTQVQAYDRVQSKLQSLARTASSNIQSAVEGALDLSGGSVTQEDFLLEQFGLRQEVPGEAARRLKDIVNRGGESPLLRFFPSLQDFGGDELRARAAKMLKEFQAGLRPELIDKEALKERAKQMLIGQQNIREVIREVTADLKSEGVLKDEFQSLAVDQLGLGFSTGLGEIDFGGQLESSLLASIQGKQQDFMEAGNMMTGFIEDGIDIGAIGDAIANQALSSIEAAIVGTD